VTKKAHTLVLLSGGLDSAVAIKHSADNSHVKLALTFDYRQRAAKKESAAARKMCGLLRIPHKVVRLPWLGGLGKNALTDKSLELPRPKHLTKAIARRTAEIVRVPGRNTIFVAIALAYAEASNCNRIVAGFNSEEGTTFPDNSADYARALDTVLRKATRGKIRLECPLIRMNKAQIVRYGRRIKAPIEYAWTCYEGGGKICWKCESCLRFKRALEKSNSLKWYNEITGSVR